MAGLRYIIILSVFIPFLIQLFSQDARILVTAEDDIEDSDADIQVEGDEGVVMSDDGNTDGQDATTEDDDDEDDGIPKASPHVDTTILFISPEIKDFSNVEIPCGKLIEVLIGFTNKGEQNFLLESSETTVRYPHDSSYVIQNFSAVAYGQIVAPQQQASVFYSFIVSDALISRSFVLEVDLKYKGENGRDYLSAVFNQTVEMVELNDGLNGETLFLYVLLAIIAVLMLIAGQQALLTGFGRRKRTRRHILASTASSGGSGGVERGTGHNSAGVDYDWLPESALKSANTPKNSPKQSPRARKNHA